jgi:hypothetical protein
MNLMPVPNEGEDQQHKGDQQQSRGFRGIDCVPVMTAHGLLFGLGGKHADIVAPWGRS